MQEQEQRHWRRWAMIVVAGATLACGVTDTETLPSNIQDPETLKNPSGALALYRGALDSLAPTLDRYATIGGIITDELTALPVPLGTFAEYTGVDARLDLDGSATDSYNSLHRIRAQAREARGFLTAYFPENDTTASRAALIGELYAAEGYAELLLADLFCSGIPLSTMDFGSNYTLAPGSTTRAVYGHAAELFDSAVTLTADSSRAQHLAAVGRGRALVALGQYADAAAAVVAVPTGFTYQVLFLPRSQSSSGSQSGVWSLIQTFLQRHRNAREPTLGQPSMGDGEGNTGIDYRSSGDPRTVATGYASNLDATSLLYFPSDYPDAGPIPLTVADGIEARLIEAEGALADGAATWLTILNDLRATVSGLALLEDPGPDPRGGDDLRIDLLFRERAFWLYLTGHRQGDLRRLVRQYQRNPSTVYPSGPYAGGLGRYGEEIVVPVPADEARLNPRYTGCNHRNA